MNYVQIVGRYESKPIVIEDATSQKYAAIDLKVKSNFRNVDGEYTYDTFSVVLWKGMNYELLELVDLDSLLGVKGRLEMKDSHIRIIAEHVEILDSY